MTHPAADWLGPRERIVAGLMSGTSLDGIDAAVVRLAGSGREVQIETLGFACRPYPGEIRQRLAAQVEAGSSDVRGLALLHAALAECWADVVQDALEDAGLSPADLDLVGQFRAEFAQDAAWIGHRPPTGLFDRLVAGPG